MNRVSTVSIDDPQDGWKAWILDVLAVLGASLFGYWFMRYLAGGFSFWFTLAALFFWGAMSVLEGFLQKNISRRLWVMLLESIALIAFFYAFAWQALAITAVLVFLCLVWGYFSVRRELRNSIEIRFFTASSRVVGKVMTGAVIFMIVMYASLMNSNGNLFVSQGGFNAFFSWTAGFVNNFYPTIPLNGSFGDFTQAVAKMQLQGNPAFQSLAPAQQDQALAQSSNEIATTLSGAPTGASTTVAAATLNEPVNNALYNYFSSLTTELRNKFGDTFIGVWGLILFLILRSIAFIAVWIAQFIALIFYELLLATGFMKVTESPATREVLEY